MMLKREVQRLGILGILGFVIGIVGLCTDNSNSFWSVLLIPIYVIGMFYAGKWLFAALASVWKFYFQWQVTSLLFNPLWGSIICLLMLIIGVSCILSFGWLIGLVRCIYSLIVAYQIDCGIQYM